MLAGPASQPQPSGVASPPEREIIAGCRALELYAFPLSRPADGKMGSCALPGEPRAELAQRYGVGRFETIGPPEIRDVDPNARYFNPYTNPAAVGNVGAIIAVSRAAGGERRRLVVGVAVCADQRRRSRDNQLCEAHLFLPGWCKGNHNALGANGRTRNPRWRHVDPRARSTHSARAVRGVCCQLRSR